MLLLAISLAFQAPDLTQKVSLAENALRMPVLAEKLEGQTGIRFACAEETQSEVVFVKVQDVPLQELMDKLAHVTGARWALNESRDGYTLRRPHDVAQKQYESFLEGARAKMAPAFKTFIENAAPDATFGQREAEALLRERARLDLDEGQPNPNASKLLRVEHGLVGGRLLARVLKGVDPGLIGALEYGRIVFSSHARENEHQIAGWERLLDQFAKEHEAMIEAANGLPDNYAVPITRLGGGTVYYKEPLGRKPAKLRVTFSRGGWDGLPARTSVFAEDGTCLFSSTAWLSSYTVPDPVAQEPAQWLRNTPIVFRPESDLVDRLVYRGEKRPISEVQRDLLTKTDQHDPLSFAVSDALHAIASETKKSVVASVPDMFALGTRTSAKLTQHSLWTQWAYSVDAAISDRWMVIWPKEMYATRRKRNDRVALAEFLEGVEREGYPTLALRANYAARARYPREIELREFYVRALLPGLPPITMEEFGALRFYGNLSESQRQTLWNGGGILAGSLSQEASASLEDWVFRSPTFSLLLSMSMEGGGTAFVSNRFESEPTSIFGRRLPADLPIAGTKKEGPALFAEPEGRTYAYMTDYQSIAWNTVMLEHPERRPDEYAGAKMLYKPGKRLILELRVSAAENLFNQTALSDSSVDPDTRAVPWRELPEKDRAPIEKLIQQILKQPLPTGSGNKRVPPPGH